MGSRRGRAPRAGSSCGDRELAQLEGAPRPAGHTRLVTVPAETRSAVRDSVMREREGARAGLVAPSLPQ